MPIKIYHSSARYHAKGFALISTILIMVLLVMTILGLLSLSTLEQRQTQESSALAETRANARMAINEVCPEWH